MEYIDFNDERIPAGKRKQAYIAWAVSKGTPEYLAKKWANKKFGFKREGKYVVKIINADCMDLPSFRQYSWTDAVMDAGCPHPERCESVIVLCDHYYAPFDLVYGFWSEANLGKDFPNWHNVDQWCKEHGYKMPLTNLLIP